MRLAHTMVRVKDLAQSIEFYQQVLEMDLLSKRDFEEGEFTLAFMGYGDVSTHPTLELTHNWGNEDSYTHGSGYGHIAIECEDIYKTCKKAEELGATITRQPGEMGTSGIHIAFLQDPDGYKIELINK